MIYEREGVIMKLKVNKDVCIGCGFCAGTCDSVFTIDDDGLAKTKLDTVPKEAEESATEAKKGCPVGAISEVE